ncbi:S41 family peptidase [Deinococcus sp. NW-56]|uniref:S41 family peptidase n=1 Tax=Deinococcus sp. NW-56 TaxID=2080419 RepID=UPI001F3E182E|nr:S41 family peptidase [Deinococcus sp. NW-56]
MSHNPLPSRVLTLALSLSLGLAGASPATDLYGSATQALETRYFGWATADRADLTRRYADVLAERCAPQGDACDYATARAVLGDLLTELGDPHTNVRDPEGAERLREVSENRAVPRTGVRTARVVGGLLVVSVMPGSPADLAGVRKFDLFTRVNGEVPGKDAGGKNLPLGPNEFVTLERRAAPLPVTLRRAGVPDRDLTLETAPLQARDEPTLGWVNAEGAGRVAVIDFPSFLPQDSSELFLKRLTEAQTGGASALVVDLRYNGGGSLGECVAAASVFAPVIYQSRWEGGTSSYGGVRGQEVRPAVARAAAGNLNVWRGPTAVLVGPGTASCAEVFSHFARGAGAVVVGEATRGVGNSGVQFLPLPGGHLLSLTVLRAFDAAGQPLPAALTPDVAAPADLTALTTRGEDTTLSAALRRLAAAGGGP